MPPTEGKAHRSRAGAVTQQRPTADSARMTSGVADDVAKVESGIEVRTTELPCVVCLTTMSLDDDQPKLGTVQWQVSPYFGLKRGKAVGFQCPNGHSSENDPDLLKAFPPRTF
jgi:hypothetical protein